MFLFDNKYAEKVFPFNTPSLGAPLGDYLSEKIFPVNF